MTSDPDPGPVAAGAHDHPDVLAVCRWLPQAFPWGAFTGRHDRVHVHDRHAYVNLWWSQTAVHPGDYVGPPRGGLAPDPAPDYDVAMPLGGYLQVRSGILTGWQDSPGTHLVVRADGEAFAPQSHGPAWPYWLTDYRSMDADDCLNAIAAVRRRRAAGNTAAPDDDTLVPDRSPLVAAVTEWVTASRPPVVCGCDSSGVRMVDSSRQQGLGVPGALLKHGGAVATLAGMGSAEEACTVVWRLTGALADPAQAGLVRAVELAARRASDSISGWPDGPLTEEAVALVAAQALRWHGPDVFARMPFWILGWIFVAGPVLDSLLPATGQADRERLRQRILDTADTVRVQRVARTWSAAHEASQALRQFQRIADGDETVTAAEADVIDLRERLDWHGDQPSGRELYERSVESVVAELAAQ